MVKGVKEEYIDVFFGNLTKAQKEKINFDQYMWHAFSFGEIKAEENFVAIDSLNEKLKNSVYVFFQKNDTVIEIENITFNEIIDNIWNKGVWDPDCYVVDKDFRWTFVITHESYSRDEYALIESSNGGYAIGTAWSLCLGPFFISLNWYDPAS